MSEEFKAGDFVQVVDVEQHFKDLLNKIGTIISIRPTGMCEVKFTKWDVRNLLPHRLRKLPKIKVTMTRKNGHHKISERL